MKPTIQQIAAQFGCTPEQVGRQFAKNYVQLKAMYQTACKTRRKVNGFTSEQLRQMINSLPMSK